MAMAGARDGVEGRRSVLGNALVNCLLGTPHYHPKVQVLHFCLMPDHLHAVLYVRQRMEKGIKTLVRGFWQGAKKLGRAHSAASFVFPNNIRKNFQEEKLQGNLQEDTAQLEKLPAMLCKEIGNEVYYSLEPIFTEMPFIRPMGRRSQLPNTIRYIDIIHNGQWLP